MRRSLASALALAASAVLLLGCAPTTSATPTTSPSSAPSSPAASTPPEIDPQIVVSLDGITVTDESGTSTADYDDSAALLALMQKATGELPEPEAVAGDSNLHSYRWDGLWVLADSDGEIPASITVTGPTVSDIPIATEGGFAVGATRAELLAGDAWALVDSEDPATAPYLGLGGREVAGTESLTKPGSVGIEFLLFAVDGDAVTQIQIPSNDFGDV